MYDRAHCFATVKRETLDSLDRYAQQRIETGGFLRAVLSNDLAGAFAKADLENRAAMFEIVGYVYNELPAPCWGSPEKVKAWLAGRKETASAAHS